MSNTADRVLGSILSSLKSGSVTISVEGEDPVRVEITDHTLTIRTSRNSFSRRVFGGFKTKLTEYRFMKRMSELLRESAMRLDLYANGKKIMSMGQGVHSFLGNEKVYFSNLFKSTKK